MKWFALLAVFICICASQTPSPPTSFPLTWHSWVVTTVKSADSSDPTYNEGRLIMFDAPNKVACRYWEQNLVNLSTTRRADYCDYSVGLHYTMNDTKPYSNCSNVGPVTDTINRITFPADFIANARFLGVNNVSQNQCNHFFVPALKVGTAYVQLDVWVDVTRGLPCQVSTLDLKTQEIITWAFDGFDTAIPHQAVQQCSIPKIYCAQANWTCQAKRDASPNNLGAALGWACSNGGVDCGPINPGGSNFYPDTLFDHCDWAFNQYYLAHRYNQGIDACNFNGVAQIVAPTPPVPPPPAAVARDINVLEFLTGMAAYDAVFPFDLACLN